jgi:hypothetical protein
MTAEIIATIEPLIRKVLVFDTIKFSHSNKYLSGGKSLYLTFALWNSEILMTQSVTYEPKTGHINFNTHPLNVNFK